MARKEELGELLAREEGKTRPEGIGEVIRAGQIFDFFAGEALRLVGEKVGFYLSPVLFTEATNTMRISLEEIFGPVASVIRVKDYDEALATANDTELGLASGVCTT